MSERYRIGVDIGGTFTDFALHDAATGAVHVWKRLSTPSDPSIGALDGIDELLAAAGAQMSEVSEVIHGTTIGANTVIERKGARTALLVTDGFRDLLTMQRPLRYSTYDIWFNRHQPLVPRDLVLSVPERLLYDGEVVTELEGAAVDQLVGRLKTLEVESVAVALLHSYADPAHERRLGDAVEKALPEASISLSHDVAPIIGEYERTSTAVVNAYIQPRFRHYLEALDAALRSRGFTGELFINQGNGGLTTPEKVARYPVRALESGPAAGVSLAAWVGGTIGRTELVAFDMGGTTAKACLIEHGSPRMERHFDVDQTLMRKGTGLPVMAPTVDLIEIGAGGGSIARVGLGIIEVGPQSAGADPGPVCYAAGGEAATVTDANVVLGYLNPDYFLEGKMELDVESARRAVAAQVGAPLGLELSAAAWGIHEAVTSNMEHAIRSVTIERGSDPRELTLVATGGAGPSHAARLARNLGMREVLFPAAAGIASAIGLLQAAPRVDLARTIVAPIDDQGVASIAAIVHELSAEVDTMLDGVGSEGARTITPRVDMQYTGQGYVIEVEFPDLDDPDLAGSLRARFENEYASMYGYSDNTAAPRVTAITVTGVIEPAAFELPENVAPADSDRREHREVYFPECGGSVNTAIHRRDELPSGTRIEGPAVIEDGQCAVLLLPGDVATVDEHRNVLASIGSAADAGELLNMTTGEA
jgi:N-methylhydantoinase A/oxoprolinase/acetone carboxylase beta subunit